MQSRVHKCVPSLIGYRLPQILCDCEVLVWPSTTSNTSSALEISLLASCLCLAYMLCFVDALNYAESVGAVFVETSAKTGVNVNALFHEISEYK